MHLSAKIYNSNRPVPAQHKSRVRSKFAVLILSFITLLFTQLVQAETVFSDGYRMGVLTKFSVRGLFHKWGVGRMLMGLNSTYWEYCTSSDDGEHCVKKNPWEFEADPSFEDLALESMFNGRPIVIKYNQYQWQNPLINESDYRVDKIFAVDPATTPTQQCVNPNARGDYSRGELVGRIVKASYKGIFLGTKSYEIIIQEGDRGNSFREMSITDENIYNCAIQWLISGTKAAIRYRQLPFNLSFRQKTNYDIESITPLAQ